MDLKISSHELHLLESIEKRKAAGLYRSLVVPDPNLVDFCSNDYLGFVHYELVKKVITQSPEKFSETGSTGSRLIRGNSGLAEELETYLAQYHKSEAAILYNSGYDANVGFFSSVPGKDDIVLYDELIHASVRDGLKMSAATTFPFRHNDMGQVESRLRNISGKNVYIAVESVYSMDGDFAPLSDLVTICQKYKAALVVDEAHAGGTYGDKGEGIVAAIGLEDKVFARLVTFGKALGVHGAVILGSEVLKEYLINFSRSFIYTTALPPASLKAILSSYMILEKFKSEIMKLHGLIALFKEEAAKANIPLIASKSMIQCIPCAGNDKVLEASQILREAGYDIRAIRYPTVPAGKERLRICIHTYNTPEQIVEVINIIKGINSGS